jgi:DNA-binding NtrC family response regulator
MKLATSSSAYDSASSRAHAPQAGAAEKSTSNGLFDDLASTSAASASLFQFTAISFSPPRQWESSVKSSYPLQNVIERSVILCETEIFSIDESWLPQQPFPTASKEQIELPQRLLAQEKDMIEAALKESRGCVSGPSGAAARLGIPRSTLESKIRTLKIDKNRFRLYSGT